MADLLKYDYNREFGIFDMLEQKTPISYQLNLFEFFCFFALNNPDDQHLLTFCVDMIDFLNLQELEKVLPVLKSAWRQIDDLLQILVRQMNLLSFQPKQISKVLDVWVMLTKFHMQDMIEQTPEAIVERQRAEGFKLT